MHNLADSSTLQYLASFRKDFARLNRSERIVEFFNEKIIIQPDVFPSDSTYSFSTQSILESVITDFKTNQLNTVRSICDVGTGCGVFLCVLHKFFQSARLLGLEIDQVARNNAAVNLSNLPASVDYSLLLSDLFEATEQRFDLIVTSLPFVCDLRYGHEIDLKTLSRFWKQVGSRLTERGRLYINWASWADFSLFEAVCRESPLLRLRVDEYPRVVQEFTWKTYVFGR